MCRYCEKGKKIEEVENDNIYFTIFGRFLRVHGRVLSIPLGRTVPIEYCPMCRKEAGRVMEAINNLQAFKNDVIEFINKYNIKSIYIDIEEIEAKVCKAGEESNSYKDVTINIEY